jgi:hypothetical protein
MSTVLLVARHPELLEEARGLSKREVEELVSKNWPRGQLKKLELRVDEEFLEKLEQVKAMCRHQVPDGDVVKIMSRALDALASQVQKRKPKTQRDVLVRDGRECSFVGSDGRRCGETAFLEIDHKQPRALGGDDSAENLRVYCRNHTRRAAEVTFGKDHMEEARKREWRRLDMSSALRNLGFERTAIRNVVARVPISIPIEDALREALRMLPGA